MEFIDTDASGTYEGLITKVEKRMSHHYQFLTSYAYSTSDMSRTSIDVSQYGGEEEGAGGIGFSAQGSAFLNPNQLINNTSGPGFYDRTHVFKVGGSYDIARPGIRDITEILVDAKTGKIISNQIESPRDQAKEAAADKK